jgi:alkylhydroperoxidase family enzyme
MGRLRTVRFDEVTDETMRSVLQYVFGPDATDDSPTLDGTPGDWWRTFALVPTIFQHCVGGFALYRSPSRFLPPELRELGQTRAGWLMESTFVFSQHVKSCRLIGMPEEKIQAIPSWSVSNLFGAPERAVLAYVDELVGACGRVSDGVFAELSAHLSDEQILELTYITALYAMHAVMTRALRLEWDGVDERVREMPGEAVTR